MTVDYFIAQGDHGEPFRDVLKDSAGAAVDINAATVKLTVTPVGGGTPIVNAATAVNDQVGDGSGDGSRGKVHRVWLLGETAVDGLYLGRWTVTFGDGSVQAFPNGGYILIEISATAPVPAATRFASSTELAARLGLDFTADEHVRANVLLALASDMIQKETGQTIALVTDDVLTRPGDYDTRIRLPQRPVVSVSSVTLNGVALGLLPSSPTGQNCYLEGDELVRLNWNSVIQDSSFGLPWAGFGFPWWPLVVTYTHGYAVIPGIVKAVCMEMCVRCIVNPGSVARETVGNTSTVYDNNRFSPTGLLMDDDERAAVNKAIRRQSGSITLR